MRQVVERVRTGPVSRSDPKMAHSGLAFPEIGWHWRDRIRTDF